jgi:hypothetical protein
MLDPNGRERRGAVGPALEHHLARTQIPASFGERTAAWSADQLGELGLRRSGRRLAPRAVG